MFGKITKPLLLIVYEKHGGPSFYAGVLGAAALSVLANLYDRP
jgi:hypothetical protein